MRDFGFLNFFLGVVVGPYYVDIDAWFDVFWRVMIVTLSIWVRALWDILGGLRG